MTSGFQVTNTYFVRGGRIPPLSLNKLGNVVDKP